jgi:hypothetical protein
MELEPALDQEIKEGQKGDEYLQGVIELLREGKAPDFQVGY